MHWSLGLLSLTISLYFSHHVASYFCYVDISLCNSLFKINMQKNMRL